jgi:hypothetical protein
MAKEKTTAVSDETIAIPGRENGTDAGIVLSKGCLAVSWRKAAFGWKQLYAVKEPGINILVVGRYNGRGVGKF